MKTKISAINILIPFLYLFLLYITLLRVGIFLGSELRNFLCNNIISTADVCNIKSIHSGDDSEFIKVFMYFLFPFRLALAIFWFFVLRYLRRKVREKFGNI